MTDRCRPLLVATHPRSSAVRRTSSSRVVRRQRRPRSGWSPTVLRRGTRQSPVTTSTTDATAGCRLSYRYAPRHAPDRRSTRCRTVVGRNGTATKTRSCPSDGVSATVPWMLRHRSSGRLCCCRSTGYSTRRSAVDVSARLRGRWSSRAVNLSGGHHLAAKMQTGPRAIASARPGSPRRRQDQQLAMTCECAEVAGEVKSYNRQKTHRSLMVDPSESLPNQTSTIRMWTHTKPRHF